MKRKYKMITFWYIRVNGRVFQTAKTEARKNELLEILPGMFPGAEIIAETKRERRYI